MRVLLVAENERERELADGRRVVADWRNVFNLALCGQPVDPKLGFRGPPFAWSRRDTGDPIELEGMVYALLKRLENARPS